MLGLDITDSAVVGTSAPVMEDKRFKNISAQVAINLGHLENFISHLEVQVDSLEEVALQNQRGLDLFMRQGVFGWHRKKLVDTMPTSQG